MISSLNYGTCCCFIKMWFDFFCQFYVLFSRLICCLSLMQCGLFALGYRCSYISYWVEILDKTTVLAVELEMFWGRLWPLTFSLFDPLGIKAPSLLLLQAASLPFCTCESRLVGSSGMRLVTQCILCCTLNWPQPCAHTSVVIWVWEKPTVALLFLAGVYEAEVSDAVCSPAANVHFLLHGCVLVKAALAAVKEPGS